jgi:AcrR family transcriptional regulator
MARTRVPRRSRPSHPSHPAAPSRPRRPARKRPDQYHHGHLRDALLREALRTIEAEGVESLTLRAIGLRLGVSRTALYRHFADKAALLSVVAQEGFRTLRHELLEAWGSGGRGRKGFEEMGVAYVRFAVAHPAHYRVMFGGFLTGYDADSALATEGAAAFQVLVDALIEQQQAGLVRDDQPLDLARFIWAIVHGIARLAIDGQFRGSPAEVEALARYGVERARTGIAVAGRGR